MSGDIGRIVSAIHGRKRTVEDLPFSEPLAAWLKSRYQLDGLIDLYGRYMLRDDPLSVAMRAAIWRAVARRVGRGLQIGSGVGVKHLETFHIGDGVFIGAQSYMQGRFDGT